MALESKAAGSPQIMNWAVQPVAGLRVHEAIAGGGAPSSEAQIAAALLLVAAVQLSLRCLSAVAERVCHLPGPPVNPFHLNPRTVTLVTSPRFLHGQVSSRLLR